MTAGDATVVGCAVLYNAVCLVAWRRAARHYRPGLSGWTRFGVGVGLLRTESYTEEGQPARRLLLALMWCALPLFALLVWLLAYLRR